MRQWAPRTLRGQEHLLCSPLWAEIGGAAGVGAQGEGQAMLLRQEVLPPWSRWGSSEEGPGSVAGLSRPRECWHLQPGFSHITVWPRSTPSGPGCGVTIFMSCSPRCSAGHSKLACGGQGSTVVEDEDFWREVDVGSCPTCLTHPFCNLSY